MSAPGSIQTLTAQSFSTLAEAAVRLSGAALTLWVVGTLATRAVRRLWFEKSSSTTAHRILVGQLVVCAWVFFRSFLSFAINRVVALSSLDLLVVGGLLAVAGRRGPSIRNLVSKPSAAIFAVLLVVIARVVWLELPRIIMLSSDPDQHAFMLAQALRLGTIPYFSQFDWGNTGFGYPEGFVALNMTWALGSGLDPRDLVQVQAVLQCILAAFLLFEAVFEAASPLRAAAGGLLTAFLYFKVLPFGYQDSMYHLEGTGRTGAVGTIALVLSCLVAYRVNRIGSLFDLVVIGASLALVEVMNITLLPTTLVMAGAITVLRVRAAPRKFVEFVRSAAVLALSLGMGFGTPWLLAKVLGVDAGRHLEQLGVADNATFWGIIDFMFSNVNQWYELVSPGPLGWKQGLGWLVGVPLVLLSIARGTPTLRTTLSTTLALWGFLALTLAPTVAASSVIARSMPGGYLLTVYLGAARTQLVWLIMMMLGVLLVRALAESLHNFPLATIPFAIVLYWKPVALDLHRQTNPGALEGITDDDLLVIADVVELKHRWSSTEPQPRILVPNTPSVVNQERWLFPVGASRILPIYDTFPIAFYYFQGSVDYTWANYQTKVCEHLDVAWLKAHRIRYLFWPAARGCVDFKPDDWKAVSTHGLSALYELKDLAAEH